MFAKDQLFSENSNSNGLNHHESNDENKDLINLFDPFFNNHIDDHSSINVSSDLNLMDFSFNLCNSSTDSKMSYRRESINDKKQVIRESIDAVISTLMDDIFRSIDVSDGLSEASDLIDFRESDSEEFEDKENIRPLSESRKSAKKNLSFDLLQAKVDAEQHRYDHEREILKEIDLMITSPNQDNVSDKFQSESAPSHQHSTAESVDMEPEICVQLPQSPKLIDEADHDWKNITISTNISTDNLGESMQKEDFYSVEFMPRCFTVNYDHLFDEIAKIEGFDLNQATGDAISPIKDSVSESKTISDQTHSHSDDSKTFDKLENHTLNESVYKFISVMVDTQNKESEMTNEKLSPHLSEIENEDFVDAKDEFETVINEDKQVSTDFNRSSFCLEQFNVSPFQSNAMNLSSKLNGSIEESFTFEDRIRLLQTKLEYENKIVDLQEELDEKMDYTDMKNQLLIIEEKHRNECQNYQEKIEEISKRLAEKESVMNEEKMQYELLIRELNETIKNIKEENVSLTNKFETEYFDQYDNLKNLNDDLNRQIYESKNENEKMKEAMLDMDFQRCELDKTIEKLNSRMMDLKLMIQTLTDDNERLAKESNAAKQSEKNLLEEIRMKQDDFDSCSKSIESLVLKFEKLEHQYESLIEENEKIIGINKNYDEIHTKLKNEINISHAFNDEKSKELEIISEQLDQKRNEIDHLRIDNEAKQEQINNLTKKIEDFKTEMIAFQSISDKKQSLFEEYQNKFDDTVQELEEQKNKNFLLTNEIHNLRQQHATYSRKINELETNLNEAITANQQLSEQIVDLKDRLNIAENKLFESEEKIVSLENDLEQSELSANKLFDQNLNEKNELLKSISNLRSEVDLKENIINNLHNSMALEKSEFEKKIDISIKNFKDLEAQFDDFQRIHQNCAKIEEEKIELLERLNSALCQEKHLAEKIKDFESKHLSMEMKFSEEKNKLEITIKELIEKLESSQNLCQQISEEKNELDHKIRNENAQIKEKLQESNRRNTENEAIKIKLEAELSKLNERNQRISSEFAKYEKMHSEEKDLMQQSLEASRKHLSSKENDLKILKMENDSLSNKLNSIIDEMKELNLKLEVKEEERQFIEKRYKIEIETSQGLQKKIEIIDESHKKIIEELREFKESDSENQSKLKDVTEKLRETVIENTKILEEKEDLTKILERKIEEIENFSQKIKSLHDKYVLVQRLVPCLQSKLDTQKNLISKLIQEIVKLINKIDENKKDYLRNEKAKEMLKLINERLSYLAEDRTVKIKKPVSNEKFVENNEKDIKPSSVPTLTVNDGGLNTNPNHKALKLRVAKSIVEERIKETSRNPPKKISLNETDKENIV
ncbi:hypothetical protein SSS_00189 [Sarcoptes scabiei]|uniref:Uncharacterized protein n=1 Tax=Sarcoptes scabiei TaxID=52283 RepID=A0A834VDU5_SARSC|nr:hypothetical protein SSS_00189 [Sarcoptes scabiei]